MRVTARGSGRSNAPAPSLEAANLSPLLHFEFPAGLRRVAALVGLEVRELRVVDAEELAGRAIRILNYQQRLVFAALQLYIVEGVSLLDAELAQRPGLATVAPAIDDGESPAADPAGSAG